MRFALPGHSFQLLAIAWSKLAYFSHITIPPPRRGEVARSAGEGTQLLRETVTPHPNPLPKGEGAHFRGGQKSSTSPIFTAPTRKSRSHQDAPRCDRRARRARLPRACGSLDWWPECPVARDRPCETPPTQRARADSCPARARPMKPHLPLCR